MQNYLKNKHIIARCNSWLKALTNVTLGLYTGDAMSVSYWRLRAGKGLLTRFDKESYDLWNTLVARVRRISCPLHLDDELYEEIYTKRDMLVERMERYRDWLEFGSKPNYLYELLDIRKFSLEFAVFDYMAEVLAECGGEVATTEWVAQQWEELHDEGNGRMDRLAELAEGYEDILGGLGERETKDAIRELRDSGKSMLDNDTTWHICADNDHRSSKGALINERMYWLWSVDDKTTEHRSVYGHNGRILASYEAYKAFLKAERDKAKADKRKYDYEQREVADEVLSFLDGIRVPEFAPLDTAR